MFRPSSDGATFKPSTREAALLLGRVTGLTEAQLIARSDERPAPEAAARFRRLLEQRLTGEPIAYILGEREFYGRTFLVDDRVLIPRPESEHLIEAALELDLPSRPWILDVGTGSGCLAVTLALELPSSTVVAIDRSLGALAVAGANAHRLEAAAGRISNIAGDLTGALALARFDLVISNPPYIDPEVRSTLSQEVTDFEPGEALFAGAAGTAVFTRLLQGLVGLSESTPILVEIGADQAHRIEEAATQAGFEVLELRRDLSGRPRVAILEPRDPAP